MEANTKREWHKMLQMVASEEGARELLLSFLILLVLYENLECQANESITPATGIALSKGMTFT